MSKTNKGCIEAALKAVGVELSDHDLKEVYATAQRLRDKVIRDPKATLKQRLAAADDNLTSLVLATTDSLQDYYRALSGMAGEAHIADMVKKRNALINLQISQRGYSMLADAEADPLKARAMLKKYTNKAWETAQALKNRKIGRLENLILSHPDLGRTGYKILRSGAMDREISEAWAVINKAPGDLSTLPKEAVALATILDNQSKTGMSEKNLLGAYIRPVYGYSGPQTHNAVRIAANKERWLDFMRSRLDMERSNFSKGQDLDAILEAEWKKMKSANHSNPKDKVFTDVEDLFSGLGNKAKKLSQHRQFVFKSGGDYFDYMQEFGQHKSVADNLISQIESDSRSIATLQYFGTNPEMMFKKFYDYIEESDFRDEKSLGGAIKGVFTDPKNSWRELKDVLVHPKHMFAELIGSTERVGSPNWAAVGSLARVSQTLSKMGLSTISSLSDIGTSAAYLKGFGVRGPVYDKLIARMVEAAPAGSMLARRAVSSGVAVDSLTVKVFKDVLQGDELSGMSAKAVSAYFKFNGMNMWNRGVRSSVMDVVSETMGYHSGHTFDELPVNMRQALVDNDISSVEWDFYRKHPAEIDYDGGKQLRILVDNYRDAPDSDVLAVMAGTGVKARSGAAIAKARLELDNKLSAFFYDASIKAVPEPNAYVRGFLHRAQPRGTWAGELLHFAGQFKGFPLALAMIVADRLGAGDYRYVVHLIVSSTILGYMSSSIKDIIRGNTPMLLWNEDGLNEKAFIRAFLQGGGGTIYADLLLHDYSKYNQGLLPTLAGPVPAQVDRILRLGSAAVRSDDPMEKIKEGGTKFVLDNMPLSNLHVLRPAMNMLILNDLYEMIDPDIMQKREKYLEETGQEVLFSDWSLSDYLKGK